MEPAESAELVDVAGRQRMLNQALAKRRLAHLLGAEFDAGNQLELITSTARALAQGGPIMVGPGIVRRAPCPPTPDIASTAETQERLLRQLPLFNPAIDISAAEVLQQTERFHDAAQATVVALSAWAQSVANAQAAELDQALQSLQRVSGALETGVTVTSNRLTTVAADLESISSATQFTARTLYGSSVSLSRKADDGVEAGRELASAADTVEALATRARRSAVTAASSANAARSEIIALQAHTQAITGFVRTIASKTAAQNGSSPVATPDIEAVVSELLSVVQSVVARAKNSQFSVGEIRNVADELSRAADAQAHDAAAVGDVLETVRSHARSIEGLAEKMTKVADQADANAHTVREGLDGLREDTRRVVHAVKASLDQASSQPKSGPRSCSD